MPAAKPQSRRPAARTAARPKPARRLGRALGGGGLALARLVGARPVLSGGLAAFAVLSTMVASNALLSQPSTHPQPLLATREAPVGTAVTSANAAAPAAPAPWHPVNDPRIMTVPLVRDVQVLLAENDFYDGEIDGRPGQATDRAIRRFQAERGLRVDGMATPLLLTQIRQMTSDVPSPDLRPGEDEVASLLASATASMATGGIAEDAQAHDLVREIQSQLTAASVAELQADGILGERTRAAIRTFQELEGMDVTGEPSEPLLARLREISGRG